MYLSVEKFDLIL